MDCPKCGAKTKVWYTERHESAVFRVRICPACSAAFKTAEEAIQEQPVKEGRHALAT
jgi:transcriptional regulator NrdR family protein